jgi:hypothetical protein
MKAWGHWGLLVVGLLHLDCSSSEGTPDQQHEPGAERSGGAPAEGAQPERSAGGDGPGGAPALGGAPGAHCAGLEDACNEDDDCCLGNCLSGRCALPECKIDGDCVYDWECCDYCHIDHCH